MSDYELLRRRNIEENQRRLAELGLLEPLISPVTRVATPRPAPKRKTTEQLQPTRVLPKRASREAAAVSFAESDAIPSTIDEGRRRLDRRLLQRPPTDTDAAADADTDADLDADDASDDGGGGNARAPFSHVQVLEAEASWKLPALASGGEHRKSCHVCTQCVASWRGVFSQPLGCSRCPLIWCSRCLGNMYVELQHADNGMAVHRLITRANKAAAFVCPKCRGDCACQRTRNGTVIERHKKAGWVGVTGNTDPLCGRPHLRRLADESKELVRCCQGDGVEC